jgi:poly-gamma-glutamate capsule biosynthesis protein CapA/YwtB (metallophosphatase superfamily)
MRKSYVLAVMVGVMALGCKPQRNITKITQTPKVEPEQIKDTIPEPVKYYLTQENDTLYTLGEEVEIEMSKVYKDTVSIIGVGDIMMGTNFPELRYLPGNDGRHLWSDVSDTLSQADVTFGNLEGVILDEGGDQKECNNPKLCYLFRTPESYLTNLTNAGFDVMSLANNHAGDFGNPGRTNTMASLDSIGIAYAGLLETPYVTFKRNKMRYGMAAFAPNKGTVSIHNIERAKSIVAHLDSICDVVIVSFHGGAEGSKYEQVTRKTETFYGENRGNVYEFSHTLIDAGADVVFGHGPHVTRAIDLYKERFIIYSLGNFCTYGRFNLRGVNGIAPIIKVYTNHEGKFLKGEVIPIRQFGAGGPKIDVNNAAIKKLQELTKKDFPEINLMIDDSGFINYLDR